MAEAILFPLAGKVLSLLEAEALNQISLPWNAKEELRKLKNTIITIRNVLLDAQEQQKNRHAVKEWLQRLKIILEEADNLFDKVATEALRRDLVINKTKKRKVRCFFTSSNPIIFRYSMGKKIKEIRERLDENCTNIKKYGFVVRALDKPIVKRNEGTTSFVDTQKIIGRDSDKDKLLQLLLSSPNNENVHVIPIVGMGGLGKTTLAQMIFNDNALKSRFHKKLWVCVSNDFDVKRILTEILTAVRENVMNAGMEQLRTMFQARFSGKKFFLVLDDVWNDKRVEWEKLEELLMIGAQGSRVLVTTRDRTVAEIVCTMSPYVLKGLSEDECLSILVKWAFKKGQDTRHPDLIEIGREIVKKCGGVPLAARTLGVLLYLKTSRNEWRLVRDSEMWAQVQNENDIIPILKLSYDQMPSSLKECFGYCSIFKKNKEIDKEQLMYHWIAHGFIQSSDKNIQLEDVCENYLEELLRRSFLEYVEPYGYKKQYKMHDLVHDLAIYVVGGETLIVKGENHSSTSKRVRHVSFSFSSNFPKSLIGEKKLRTMMREEVIDEDNPITISVKEAISNSRCLRVLDYGLDFDNNGLPESIGKLKHLRYLRHNGISAIPKSICELLNLQFLELRSSNSNEWLENSTNLRNLRVLKFSTFLTCLPDNIQNLTSLHKLVITSCPYLQSLGTGLRCISSLEHLEIWNPQNLFVSSESDFQGPASLKYLFLSGIPRVKQLPMGIQDTVATLKHLRLHNCYDMSLTEKVRPNLQSLEVLEIYFCNKIISLPEGMRHLKLSHLEIFHCELLGKRCNTTGEDWPKISHVPHIRVNGEVIKSIAVFPCENKINQRERTSTTFVTCVISMFMEKVSSSLEYLQNLSTTFCSFCILFFVVFFLGMMTSRYLFLP